MPDVSAACQRTTEWTFIIMGIHGDIACAHYLLVEHAVIR